MTTRIVKIATSQYPIGRPARWNEWADHLSGWVASGAALAPGGLLIFPEYGSLEVVSIRGPEAESDIIRQIDTLTELAPDIDALHQALAREHGVFVLAASLPLRLSDGRVVNRARLFAPTGETGHQDKQIMTKYERTPWGISGNHGLRIFDTPLGRLGVAICYDVEFPLIGRALGEAGAEIILAPSCTDTRAGAYRVRTGALARALENQIITVVSPTVGAAPWLPSADTNHGRAGIYGPSDTKFHETGTFVEGEFDKPCWIHGEVDLGLIEVTRTTGNVLAFRHWTEQPGASSLVLPEVEVVRLGFGGC
jgi:predicted amidohydrolase